MSLGHTFRRGATSVAVAALAVVAFAGTSQAIDTTDPVTLTGVVRCELKTGHQVVDWTLTNPTSSGIHLSTGFVNGGEMTAGEPLQAQTELTPNAVPAGGTASGTTQVSGDGVGNLHLELNFSYDDGDPSLNGVVNLPGGCGTSTGTTTVTVAPTSSTNTTAAAAASAARTVSPHFTG